ncbi:hypothetical protein BKH43_07015 [Helicobacter sp. 13S00401-1]|uniref:hypothetical protein n=1 Tax=Helicobacter sp. 13S00401-1 TaxID=1905758 RepID=UPI000BA644B0|nr:hypothetical protein [Helicobacter sp. 13S00401-1]PAF49325.1 hypothetical protein BKH43_07015 [Helicobacter sp. 13S00401-1]
MEKKLLVSALLSLLISSAYGAQAQGRQDEKDLESSAQSLKVDGDKADSKKADSKEIDSKKDTFQTYVAKSTKFIESVKGFAFGRYTANFGKDASGYAQQWRMILNAKTIDYKGFSFGAGVFFGLGTSIADGANSFDDIAGSRAAALGRRIGDRFSISQIYVQKDFKDLKFKAGRINIVSPMNDSSLDIGSALKVSGESDTKIGKLHYEASVYDSWNTDYGFYILSGRGQLGSNGSTDTSFGFGNTMAIFGLSYEDTLNKGRIKARFFYSYANRLYDYMIFSDVTYSHPLNEHVSFSLKAQTALLGLNANPSIKSRNAGAYVLNQEFLGSDPNFHHAKDRGIYNINASLEAFSFGVKVGFLGSFADGYGVMHDGEGDIDVPGKIWLSGITASYEGFSFLGSGSKQGSSLYLPYIQLSYKIDSKFKIGLDLVALRGKNNMPLFTAKGIGHNNSSLPKLWPTLPKGADDNVFKDIKIYEATFTASYNFTPNFRLSGYYGMWFGDVSLSRARIEARYTL